MAAHPDLDNYWRLDEYKSMKKTDMQEALRKAGYNLDPKHTHTPKTALILMMQRLDCGLLIYDNCTSDELRKFTADRNITQNPKTDAIETLRDADKNPKFSKFMSLPLAIRLMIYLYYMSSFPEVLDCVSQPPLARASRMLRQEMLPVFFTQQTFVISYCPYKYSIVSGKPCRWRMTQTKFTRAFMNSIPCEQLANLTHIQLQLHDIKGQKLESCLFAASLNLKTKEYDGLSCCFLRPDSRQGKRAQVTWRLLMYCIDDTLKAFKSKRSAGRTQKLFDTQIPLALDAAIWPSHRDRPIWPWTAD